MGQRFEPIACSLPLRDAAEQAGEWTDLFGHAVSYDRLADGIEVSYPLRLADQVEDLVSREAACCAWLNLDTTRTDDAIRVRLTSENPDSAPVIEALVGL